MFLTGSGLVATIALSHILGASELGEFYMGVVVYSSLWFALNLGVTAVASSKVAAATKSGDVDEVRDWMAFSLEATLLMGALCLLLCWTVLPGVVEWWIAGDGEQAQRVAHFAVLLALEPLISLPRLLCSVAFQGQRRMASLARMENVQELCRTFLVIGGAFWTGSALGAVIGQLISTAIGNGVALHYYRKELSQDDNLPSYSSVVRRIGKVRMRGRWGLGVRMGLVRNLDIYAVQVLPSLVLGRYGTTESVTYLRVAQRFIGVLKLSTVGVGRTGFAVLSAAGGEKDPSHFGKVYRRTSLIGGLCVIAASIVLWPFLPWFLTSFWPSDFKEPVLGFVLILMPGLWLMGFSVVNGAFYLVADRLQVGIWITTIAFILIVPLMFVLAHLMPQHGIAIALSLAYSASISHVIYALIWFHKGQQGFSPGGNTAKPLQ